MGKPFSLKILDYLLERAVALVTMARKGHDLKIVYLDDFLLISKCKHVCAEPLRVLIQLIRKLGFMIHWDKVVDPTTHITFLGIELDSMAMWPCST